MAVNFTKQATQTLAPAYDQQIKALKTQIPAIEQLYAALGQQQQGQKATETQNIFENASGRGLLRSTIPVDQQAGLEQTYLQKGAQLGAEQVQKVGAVNSDIYGANISKANAIAQLTQALQGQSLDSQKFAFDKKQSTLELKQRQALADREYKLQKELAALGIF